jgi:hypothetical protein
MELCRLSGQICARMSGKEQRNAKDYTVFMV